MIGRTLGHYLITHEIGSGGMGVVYRAHDHHLQRDVAIKVLKRQGPDDDTRRLMRHEALALSRTTHPNIATVHELGGEGDVDFIVMEFIPGETLHARIADGTLPETDVIRLGRELAEGLDAAHRNGVIHRDLKPANLRITPDGHLKILDFGLAQRHASAETLTSPGPARGGTLLYLSPEVVNGHDADARSDIYAVGAVLYEMVTGRRAHAGRSDGEILNAILNRMPPLPADVGVTVSPALQAVMFKALDKNPERRYQSARELAIDLARISDPQSSAAWPSAGAPRRRWLGWIAAAAAIAIVIAVAIGWPPATPPAPSNQSGPIRLAVMPTQVVATAASANEWTPLVQNLFADQFTGLTEIGVLDSLSLNSLIGFSAGEKYAPTPQSRERLMAFGTRLALESQVVSSAGGFELRAGVLDLAAGERRFSDRASFKDEATLAAAVSTIADNVVAYLQVDVLGGSRDDSLRPWIAFRNRNIQAVRAFIQANDYLFHFQSREGEEYLRRAIDLDPEYTAPRIFLIGGLLGRGQRADAEEQMRHLREAEPNASPFEQAMIRYADARMRNDTAQMMRQLAIALNFSPGNFILMMNLGGQKVQNGNCAEALPLLDPLIGARWAYPPLFPLWGYCAVSAGRFPEVIEALQFAQTVTPVNPNIYALLDITYTAMNRSADAAKYHALRTAGGTAPVLAQLCAQLADAALARKDATTALALMRKAVEEAPPVARYHNRLGALLVELGQFADAEKAYHDALTAEPVGKDADDARAQLDRIQKRVTTR